MPEVELDADALRMVIEAILFASTEPVSIEQFLEFFGEPVGESDVRTSLSALWERYEKAQSSLQVVQIGKGYKMTTRAQYANYIERFFTKRRKVWLSKAGLEVLSIVAYHQPVSMSQIDHIRGVDSKGVARGLLQRGLLAVRGRAKAPGRPLMLVTTDKFLDHFGLSSLESLPKPEELVERSDFEQISANEGEEE